MSVQHHSRALTRVSKSSDITETEWFGIPSRQPENQRARWNFLTWSVFLAQMLAAQQFLGAGAKAAQDVDSTRAASSKSDPHANLASPDPLDSSVLQSDAADVGVETAALGLRGYTPNVVGFSQYIRPDIFDLLGGKAGKNDATGSSQSDGGSSHPTGAGGSESTPALSDAEQGGPSPFEPIPADPGTVLTDLFDTNVLGNLLDNLPSLDDVLGLDVTDWLLTEVHAAGNAVSQVLDTTLDQLTGLPLIENTLGMVELLGESIDDTLSYATGLQLVRDTSELLSDALHLSQIDGLTPLYGETLDDTLGTIVGNSVITSAGADSVVSSVAESVGIVSEPLELTPLQHTGDLSSGGIIAFVNPIPSNQLDDLFTGGRYSDYNLALQSDTVGEIADALGSSVVGSAASLSHTDAPTDIETDNLLPLSAHDADALLTAQANTLGELGERDHLM